MSHQCVATKKKSVSKPVKRSALASSAATYLAQPLVKPTRRLPIQAKLTVGQPNDKYEREADRVADKVMGMPEPVLQRQPENEEEEALQTKPLADQITPLVQRQEASPEEKEELQTKLVDEHLQRQPVEEEEEELQAKEVPGQTPQVSSSTESRINSLKVGGQPLDPSTRSFFEPRFGHDFSQVKVHADSHASEAAKSINARAFTMGNHVVMGAGEYQPKSQSGQRLLGHELTHVIQQGEGGSSRRGLSRGSFEFDPVDTVQPGLSRQSDVLQRQNARQPFRQRLFVVRDRGIGLGTTPVANLSVVKAQLMRTHNAGVWSLVLVIHGSLDRLGAQEPPNWQQNAIFYDAAAINALFSADSNWVRWRDRYGPNHLSLAACQVSATFEGVLISNFTRHARGTGSQAHGSSQPARGLGTGCKPLSSGQTYTSAAGHVINSRARYNRLPSTERQDLLNVLTRLNQRVGYYGVPPVPSGQIIEYFLDVQPVGQWPVVEIGHVESDGSLTNTHIPFWNRTTGPQSSRFRRLCDQGVGVFRGHRSRAPSAPRQRRRP